MHREAFEAYAQAIVSIPDVIPLIGGIQIGGAALGLNTKRIWGALESSRILNRYFFMPMAVTSPLAHRQK